MLVVMLVAQLFGYENFAGVLAGVLPFNDLAATAVVSAAIVLAELLALPYLLRTYISRLMRVLSALAGFVISGFWLLSALTNAHAANSGLFSTSLTLPGGLLSALWTIVLFAAISYIIFADSRFRHDTTS